MGGGPFTIACAFFFLRDLYLKHEQNKREKDREKRKKRKRKRKRKKKQTRRKEEENYQISKKLLLGKDRSPLFFQAGWYVPSNNSGFPLQFEAMGSSI